MAEETKTASLPVSSESMHAEIKAAIARIACVPVGRTLIDDIDKDHWKEGVDGSIEAGSLNEDLLLDTFDAEHRLIA